MVSRKGETTEKKRREEEDKWEALKREWPRRGLREAAVREGGTLYLNDVGGVHDNAGYRHAEHPGVPRVCSGGAQPLCSFNAVPAKHT